MKLIPILFLTLVALTLNSCMIADGAGYVASKISDHNYRVIDNPKTSKATLIWLTNPPRSWAMGPSHYYEAKNKLEEIKLKETIFNQ